MNKRMLIVIAIVVVVIALPLGVYFLGPDSDEVTEISKDEFEEYIRDHWHEEAALLTSARSNYPVGIIWIETIDTGHVQMLLFPDRLSNYDPSDVRPDQE